MTDDAQQTTPRKSSDLPLWAAAFVAIVFVAASSWWMQSRIEIQIREDTGKSLETVLETTENALHNWQKERQGDALIWAQSPDVRHLSEELLGLPADTAILVGAPAQSELRAILAPVLRQKGYRGFFVISRDGMNYASTRNNNIGVPSPLSKAFLQQVWEGNAAVSLPQTSDVPLPGTDGKLLEGRSTMFVAAPIKDFRGKPIAALVLRIDPVNDFTPILQHGRIGRTGESYAFDKEGRVLSESRFDGQLLEAGLVPPGRRAILNVYIRDPGGNLMEGYRPGIPRDRQPLTRMARSATAGEKGMDLEGYRDYRGVPVIGVWNWSTLYGMGIATEIDVIEAYDSLFKARRLNTLEASFTIALIVGLMAVFMVSRRRILTSEARTRAVVENAVDGIITIDEGGIIETFNPAAERIFGCSVDEAVGQNIKMLMPEPYHGEHDGYLRNYVTSGDRKIIGIGREVEGLRKDGSSFPLDLGVSEISVRGHRRFVGMVRDITERKEIERMKTEFVSTVSHELRTPLTSIQGALALIAKSDPEGLDDKYKKLIGIAHKNSGRLVRLINDILDIEKIESGRMEFKLVPQEIMPLAEHAIEANQAFAKQFDVEIVLREDLPGAMIEADADRITQVFTNLLSNAAKFSPEGGTVDVSVARRGANLRMEITDHGDGIPEGFRESIFGKFSQADSSATRKREGSGLGLNIAKAIVESHGGAIGFETETGTGATFFFQLPEWKEQIRDDASADGRRVLVCEDEPDIATLLRMIIEGEGVPCDVAHTAARARELLKTNSYAAMTLDLMLPDEDGLSLLNDLRGDDRTRDLPVIIVSAVSDERQKQLSAATLGIVDWMQKPIDQERLLKGLKLTEASSGAAKPRVLHVEDDPDLLAVVDSFIGDTVQLEKAATLAQARQKLSAARFDLVLLDVGLPDGSGLDLICELRRPYGTETPVILFTAQDVPADISRQVSDVLTKAQTPMDKLIHRLFSAIDKSQPKNGGNPS